MRLAIIGGGISGLSAAYYAKKFALPISEILIYEASGRLGGWIDSKKVKLHGNDVYFEKGPRTLRIATGELKELNSLQLADELNLGSNIELIPKTHPASKNRFIYYDKKINAISTSLIKKNDLLPKRLISYLFHELFKASKRPSEIEDESIWSFISRRVDSSVANNLVDPMFKGICGGDIKYLSSATLLKNFYEFEKEYGSILKGAIKKNKEKSDDFPDLSQIRKHFLNQSVWRIKTGMHSLVNKLEENLLSGKNVHIRLNEPVEQIEFLNNEQNNKIKLKSHKGTETVDLVISSIYSKYIANTLSEEYSNLKMHLNKIESISMALVNIYFKKDVLPVKGFGYLVPTSQNSPILGCIFDSVFNEPTNKSTVLTAMLGGAWYDKYIGNKNSEEIYKMTIAELKKHLNLKIDPDYHEVNLIKDCIPQYKVGHQKILSNINDCLKEKNLQERFFLIGNSYDGIGVNDCIFNSRKLIQKVLLKNLNKI